MLLNVLIILGLQILRNLRYSMLVTYYLKELHNLNSFSQKSGNLEVSNFNFANYYVFLSVTDFL